MSRVSKEDSLRTRASILETASRLFRERGLDGTSIADLMGASGLTHGGFYGHFPSKDALAAEACAETFATAQGRWERRLLAKKGSSRQDIVDAYLSTRSRDRCGENCPTPSLAADVARTPADSDVRRTFTAGVEGLVQVLQRAEDDADPAASRRAALADYATMVGAMVLARATTGHAISEELLRAARHRLTDAAAPAKRRPARARKG